MTAKRPRKKFPRPDLKRLVPPGFPLDAEMGAYTLSLAVSAITGAVWYASNIERQKQVVFRRGGVTRENFQPSDLIRPDVKMPDFVNLLPALFTPYLLMALVLAAFVLLHYLFFYQGGSRSIYLMRRLPDRWELHRRCLSLPLLAAAVTLLTAVLIALLFFLSYILTMPPEVLNPHQWAKIWSVIP